MATDKLEDAVQAAERRVKERSAAVVDAVNDGAAANHALETCTDEAEAMRLLAKAKVASNRASQLEAQVQQAEGELRQARAVLQEARRVALQRDVADRRRATVEALRTALLAASGWAATSAALVGVTGGWGDDVGANVRMELVGILQSLGEVSAGAGPSGIVIAFTDGMKVP